VAPATGSGLPPIATGRSGTERLGGAGRGDRRGRHRGDRQRLRGSPELGSARSAAPDAILT